MTQTACPASRPVSPAGSTSVSNCTCSAGGWWNGTACAPCTRSCAVGGTYLPRSRCMGVNGATADAPCLACANVNPSTMRSIAVGFEVPLQLLSAAPFRSVSLTCPLRTGVTRRRQLRLRMQFGVCAACWSVCAHGAGAAARFQPDVLQRARVVHLRCVHHRPDDRRVRRQQLALASARQRRRADPVGLQHERVGGEYPELPSSELPPPDAAVPHRVHRLRRHDLHAVPHHAPEQRRPLRPPHGVHTVGVRRLAVLPEHVLPQPDGLGVPELRRAPGLQQLFQKLHSFACNDASLARRAPSAPRAPSCTGWAAWAATSRSAASRAASTRVRSRQAPTCRPQPAAGACLRPARPSWRRTTLPPPAAAPALGLRSPVPPAAPRGRTTRPPPSAARRRTSSRASPARTTPRQATGTAPPPRRTAPPIRT